MTREREPQGFEKLSRLQKVIMVALMDSKYVAMKRRKFNAWVYEELFQETSPSTRASLSRSLRSLEERGYIVRLEGCYRLNNDINSGAKAMAALLQIDLAKKIEEHAAASV